MRCDCGSHLTRGDRASLADGSDIHLGADFPRGRSA
jgi:hypothetical protein